jgi:hypothetical protein
LSTRILFFAVVCLCLPFPAALAQETTPQYGTLNKDTMEKLGNGPVRFDLALFRLAPSLLDNKANLSYFIALNNCDDKRIGKMLQNELDYPTLAAFYRPKAQEILDALQPYYVGFAEFRGPSTRIWDDQGLYLGEYNTTRHAFPLIYKPGPNGGKQTGAKLDGSLAMAADRGVLSKSCPTAWSILMFNHSEHSLPSIYSVQFEPASFDEFPMDEAAARSYIDNNGSNPRRVTLLVDVQLVDGTPQLTNENGRLEKASFGGQLSRITATREQNGEPVGTLMDNQNSLPPAVTRIEAKNSPPSAATSPQELQTEIATVAWVAIAADTCGWKLTDEQQANVRRFMSDIQGSSKFNPKYSLNSDMAQDRAKIGQAGRLDFCESPLIRQKFAERSATLWPKGTVAAPPK